MNPWSHYEHQPQLVQACVVAVAALRISPSEPAAPPQRVARFAALAWSALGVLDFLVYAFGYQVARLTPRDTEPIQQLLGWLQVPVLVALAIALSARRYRQSPAA